MAQDVKSWPLFPGALGATEQAGVENYFCPALSPEERSCSRNLQNVGGTFFSSDAFLFFLPLVTAWCFLGQTSRPPWVPRLHVLDYTRDLRSLTLLLLPFLSVAFLFSSADRASR